MSSIFQTSDGNPKNRGIFVSMAKKSIPIFKKEDLFDRFRREGKVQDPTLESCVTQIYPDTKPNEFMIWHKKTREEGFEIEVLLFMALICGFKFRILRLDPNKALESLWKWFTQNSNGMSAELAQLVVEALEPGITKAIENRGYRRGPGGEYVKKKGRPPEGRGAWIAAFVIEEYLRRTGMRSIEAKAKAFEFTSILLGRKAYREIKGKEKIIELGEYYREYKKAPKSNIKKLTSELLEGYEFHLNQDGIISKDLEPSKEGIENHANWRARHKSLRHVLRDLGCEGVCSGVLTRIQLSNVSLWEPFWDM